MSEPVWIEKEDCLGFHNVLLSRFGGLDGIRDEGLLESALSRPQQLLTYGSPTHFELAASYAFGIVKNHPFLDGNKRTGLLVATAFLELNGWEFQASEEAAVLQTRALAAGEVDADGYAIWLRDSCVPA